jgi:hypothetical protein
MAGRNDEKDLYHSANHFCRCSFFSWGFQNIKRQQIYFTYACVDLFVCSVQCHRRAGISPAIPDWADPWLLSLSLPRVQRDKNTQFAGLYPVKGTQINRLSYP